MDYQIDVAILSSDPGAYLLSWHVCDNGMDAGCGQAWTHAADSPVVWIGTRPQVEVEGRIVAEIARVLHRHDETISQK